MQSMAAHSFMKGYNQWVNIILTVLIVVDIIGLKTQSPFTVSVFVGFLATMSAGNIWDFWIVFTLSDKKLCLEVK